MLYKLLIETILGAVIGYITNDIAIKMLFNPRKAIYIGKFHVPFTPGVIPKQKPNLAKAIGEVVSTQLLDVETLCQSVLSQATLDKLRQFMENFFSSLKNENRTIGEMLELRFSKEDITSNAEKIERKASEALTEKLVAANVGNIIMEDGINALIEKKMLDKVTSYMLTNVLRENVKSEYAEKINEVVKEKAPDIIYQELEYTKIDIMTAHVRNLYSKYQDKQEMIINMVIATYSSVLGDNLEKILKAVDVEQIVVDKINSFDEKELEQMILGIVNQQLKAIVYLGALLGALMGFLVAFLEVWFHLI